MTSTRLASSGFSENKRFGWGAQTCGLIKRGLGLLFKDFLHERPGVAADEF